MRALRNGLVALLALSGCASHTPKPVAGAPPPCVQVGEASWYRPSAGRSANGEHYGPGSLIAAHRALPFGTPVRVLDTESGRSVTVTIADRGPFVDGRIIDLSPAAAKQLGMRQEGVAEVRLQLADSTTGCPFRD